MLMQHYVFYAHHVSPRDKIQKKKKKKTTLKLQYLELHNCRKYIMYIFPMILLCEFIFLR